MQDKDKDFEKPEKPAEAIPEAPRDEPLDEEDLERISGGQVSRPQEPGCDWW